MKLFLLALALSATVSAAAATEVPEPIRGIWAWPSCQAPKDTLVIYRGYYLWMDQEQTAFSGVTAKAQGDEPWVQLTEASGYPIFFEPLDNNHLREYYAPDDAPLGAVPQPDWDYHDFESCNGQLPRAHAILSGETVAFFNAIDPVYGRCDQDRQTCAQTVFDAIDVSGDARLSPAEVARLIRIALYIAAVSGDEPVERQELAALMAASLPLAPLAARSIVSSFDYDNDGTLSLAELTQDRGSLIDQIEGQMSLNFGFNMGSLKDSLGPMGQLLENWRR